MILLVYIHATVCMWMSGDNLQGLSFHHVRLAASALTHWAILPTQAENFLKQH